MPIEKLIFSKSHMSLGPELLSGIIQDKIFNISQLSYIYDTLRIFFFIDSDNNIGELIQLY